ncbi:MAG: hypothetical protein WDN48_07110 [Pseudolabrys sp.]
MPSAERWQKNNATTQTTDKTSRSGQILSRSAIQPASAHSAMPMPNR